MSEIKKKSALRIEKRELLLSTTHAHCLALARSASKFHAVIQDGGCPQVSVPDHTLGGPLYTGNQRNHM